MVVLVYLTTKTKLILVPANSLGLETDVKLRKVISNFTATLFNCQPF